MSLAPGTKLGHYQIVAPLGAGGMGEVYRARDSKLNRDVALKLLPAEVAGDRERLTRFDREAQILASLNHPNISAIHGVEDTTQGPALVLELVEGPTLKDRLAGKPLSLNDTLQFARQIADALETAHEQGVIHRDLKPANIKVRPDGTIKVLDFGIAKMLAPLDRVDADDQPTVSATMQGALIGTPSYMSPEQARGAEATRRSDVWAFGAILFEMLTGRRAFTGATTSEVLSAILQGTLDLNTLPASTPPTIARLVRRCLERDPKSRLHDIGDARLEIEDAERALRGEHPSTAPASTPRPTRSNRLVLGLAVVIGAAALAFAAYLFSTRSEDSPQEVRLQMPPPAGMRFVSVPAVSPDGRQIVFAAVPDAGGDARLWLRPLGATAATELPGTVGASFPFWSADSRVVGFFAAGQLKRVAVAGGNPVVICPAANGRGGLWLEDDTIVFAPATAVALMRVNAAGGTPAPFTTLAEDEVSHRFPMRVPGQRLLYFSQKRVPGISGTRLIAMDDPARAVSFIPTAGAAEYVNGHLVFPQGSSGVYAVIAQPLALPGGQLTGDRVEIGRSRVSEVSGRATFATAPTGVVAVLGPIDGIGQFTWISRDGRVLETVGEPASQLGVELSPDRQQAATFRSGDVWTMNLARPVPIRLSPGRHPIWSPDGASILLLFQGRGIGTFDLVSTSLTTGESRERYRGVNLAKPSNWMPDGRLVWLEGTPWQSIHILAANGPPVSGPQDGVHDSEARVSPDGRWIAFASNRSGRFEIEVSSFPEIGRRYPVSIAGGGYPRWRSDGRESYFLSPDGRMMAAAFAPGAPPTIAAPAPLFEVPPLITHPDRLNFAAYEYDVNADGSRFLINRMVTPPDPNLTIIVDWHPPR